LAQKRFALWRNLDEPGFERTVLSQTKRGSLLSGTILIALPDATEVRYRIEFDPDRRTRALHVELDGSDGQRTLDLRCEAGGGWRNGDDQLELGPDVFDVDLSISPATNTLPIRRLGLAIGEWRDISVAWVRFPELIVERHDQTYARLGENVYRFTEGNFTADLEVDEHGLVVNYPGLWERVFLA
jgi:hypothetical protein